MKIALGTFACTGVETHLGSDLRSGVLAALAEYARRIESGLPSMAIPPFAGDSTQSGQAVDIDLPIDPQTMAILEREAAKQGATVSQLAAHSVLLYLAELDRLTPPPGSPAV